MTDPAASGPIRSVRRPAYERAAAWAAEMRGTLRASRAAAWLSAGGAVTAAVLLGAALATVGPLRAAAPYTIVVERQAGFANAVRRLDAGALIRDPVLTDSLVARYVLAREAFAAGSLVRNHRLISLWSDPAARARYDAEITRANPASPVALYTTTTTVTPVVKSVSRLSPTQALVRFDTIRREAGTSLGEQRGWLATITYRFDPEPMRNLERFDNPLGFRVTDYRREPDGTLPVQVAVSAP